MVRHSKHFSFYTHYLMKWESALTQLMAKDPVWPEFTGTNHAQYMDGLVNMMKTHRIDPPKSNTQRSYIWRLVKEPQIRDIFVLCVEKKIILYGLPKSLFNALDKQIDGESGPVQGQFSGKLQKDKAHYVGIWKI